ncbi:MAG: formyltransferase family protein [Methylococcaceae bacterium]
MIDEPSKLTKEFLIKINPRYIFFPHWSAIVPKEITAQYECVCFHETDLPYGRGGSPIQNLIERGHKETQITALKMTDIVDGGPIYMKRQLSLLGLAEEIFIRAADLVAGMIEEIVVNQPEPVPQVGEAVCFGRRKPEQSEIDKDTQSLEHIYDLIRMLDAQDYPHAYLDIDNFRIEFTRPALRTDFIEANVIIKSKK